MKQCDMARNTTAPGATMVGSVYALLAITAPAWAADVTYERLLNPEPQNWLMRHHLRGPIRADRQFQVEDRQNA